jgi:toxin FitB
MTWLDRRPAESLWITSITLFEARPGLSLLPSGRRRQTLEAAFTFDSAAAIEAPLVAAARQKNGRPVDMLDTQIASVAARTRNLPNLRALVIGQQLQGHVCTTRRLLAPVP